MLVDNLVGSSTQERWQRLQSRRRCCSPKMQVSVNASVKVEQLVSACDLQGMWPELCGAKQNERNIETKLRSEEVN
jgi:hypothetical protein